MNRRTFHRLGFLGSAALTGVHKLHVNPGADGIPFPLDFAPHPGMFRHHAESLPGQLEFIAHQGFRAFEDNDMRTYSRDQQSEIAETMERLELRMGVFVAHRISWTTPNLASGDLQMRKEFLSEIRESIGVAKRLNATWMTVVPGHLDLHLDIGFQTVHVIESLKQAAGILEPHGLIMVLEPLNPVDHPGMFLTRSAQAYEICKAVNSPACKILFDIYHQQITEGNLIPNIDQAWDEIAYFQIGDNPGRKEPTTGEINYLNIFRHLKEKNYTGILGMEHGNAGEGKNGEQAVIKAYRKCSQFG